MRPALAFRLLALLGLTATIGGGVAQAAVPPRVALEDAPKAERSPGFPACGSPDVDGLPSRAAFESDPPHLPKGPRHERGTSYSDVRQYSSLRDGKAGLEHVPFGLMSVNTKALPDGRVFWYSARVGAHPELRLLAFVQKFRTELGFRDGDWPELVGQKRVFRRYANGAISLRYFGAQYPELPREDEKESRGESYAGLLPVPADGLAAPPDLTGNQALAIVHDMNPYLELLPLEEPGRPIAARLVVASGIEWDPRLAWEVRYKYACWEPGVGKERPYLVAEAAYAYVDARSGALVLGRDENRGGVALNGPEHASPGFCATGLVPSMPDPTAGSDRR